MAGIDSAFPDALPQGTVLGPFRIGRVLGQGSFGITYRGYDEDSGTRVVIKDNLPMSCAMRDRSTLQVHSSSHGEEDLSTFEWSLSRFLREASLLATFDHPGVVPVLQRFRALGTAFFVMPEIRSVDFHNYVEYRLREEGREFSETELAGLAKRVLDALQYLHSHRIVHRDIKPANLLIREDNGKPVLIDFGAARQLIQGRAMTLIGTPAFQAFEQTQANGSVGPWTDLYALAGTLYVAMTGQIPPSCFDRYSEDVVPEILSSSRLRRRYSKDFLAQIRRALELDYRDRFPSADAWLAAMGCETHGGSPPVSEWERLAERQADPLEVAVPGEVNPGAIALFAGRALKLAMDFFGEGD